MDSSIIERAPFPSDVEAFADDIRISLNSVTRNYQLEDERGEQWEWNEERAKWVPSV